MFRQTYCWAVVAAMWGCLPLAGRCGDWPQWRGPNRDGVWDETGVLQTFPSNGLSVVWRVPVGRGYSSPVVAQGRVFVTDVQLARPAAKERVLCLEEASGKVRWTHSYAVDYPDWAFSPDGGGVRATPIVREGRVFTLGAMGHLFCLDAATGAVVWKKPLAKEYDMREFTGITASPLIEGKLLILYLCGKPSACVVAFDKDTGREVWRALDDAFSYSSLITFTASGRRQVVVWTQDAITSLDPATGRTWWRERLPTPGDMAVSTPVYDNHRLLIGGLMMRLAMDKPEATVLWPEAKAATKRVLSNTSTALLQGDYVYSARISGELVCLEAATGKVVWETNTVTSLRNGSSIHLTPNGDAVFLFTDQGNLIRARLSARGYQELGRARLIEPSNTFGGRDVVWPPPAYANRHVFARNDKEIVCASLAAKP